SQEARAAGPQPAEADGRFRRFLPDGKRTARVALDEVLAPCGLGELAWMPARAVDRRAEDDGAFQADLLIRVVDEEDDGALARIARGRCKLAGVGDGPFVGEDVRPVARKPGHLRWEERHEAEELPPAPGVGVDPAGVRMGGVLGRLAPERVEHDGVRRPGWKVAAVRKDRKRGTRLRHRQAPYANIRGHGEMR